MYHIWVDQPQGPMKMASADRRSDAYHYAQQYRDEGRVTLKSGNKVIAIFSNMRGPKEGE